MRLDTLAICLAVSVLGAGCATPYSPSSYLPQSTARYSLQTDAQALRYNLSQRRKELAQTAQQAEAQQLREEIEALELRLLEVERQLANDVSNVAPSGTGYTGSGPIYTGPRGGRYTIGPSGRKNYIRRK